MRSWRSRATLLLAGLAAAGCTVGIGPDAGSDFPYDALEPAGAVAREQDQLWNITLLIAIGVFVLVFGLVGIAIVRFRDRGEAAPPKQVHGNTRLEITWTVIPALVLAVLAVPTVQTIFELAAPPAENALDVRVVARQYWWEFEYAESGVVTAGELHIPTDREIFLSLDGAAEDGAGIPRADVIHSFWVPRLAGKQDFVPGTGRILRLQADAPGTYPGNCAEFCGLSHANMGMAVIAHEPAEFEDWLAAQQEPAATDQGGLVAEGETIAGEQCVACHSISGNPSQQDPPARIGPDLTHFADRERFAGHIFDTTAENIDAWLENPAGVKPGAQMPDLNLDPQQREALTAYLLSLE